MATVNFDFLPLLAFRALSTEPSCPSLLVFNTLFRVSIRGQISGIQHLTLTGSLAILELFGIGHTLNYAVGAYILSSLTLLSNSRVKVYSDQTTPTGRGITLNAVNITVTSGEHFLVHSFSASSSFVLTEIQIITGAMFDGIGSGFGPQSGPGKGSISGITDGVGAGHGGEGGLGSNGYGSFPPGTFFFLINHLAFCLCVG